ncbi:MAG: hypothetical protein IPL35_15270 [Sphingobacteriales bacterium]|nr:hypothetical protein [Sphingobacteriales bacterium]
MGIFFQNSAGRYKEMWKNLIRFDEGFIIFDSEIKDKKMGLPTSRAFTFLDWTITLEKNYPDCIIYRWRRYDPFLDAKLPRFEADKNGNTSFNETEGESTILFPSQHHS